jgi:hypothetical protein
VLELELVVFAGRLSCAAGDLKRELDGELDAVRLPGMTSDRGRLRAGGLLAGGAGTAWCLRASVRSTACPGELVGQAGVGGAGRNQDAERD